MKKIVILVLLLASKSIYGVEPEQYRLWAQIDAATTSPGKLLVIVLIKKPNVVLNDKGKLVDSKFPEVEGDAALFSYMLEPGESKVLTKESKNFPGKVYKSFASVKKYKGRFIVEYGGTVELNKKTIYTNSAWTRTSLINF